ncbi:early nodulin-like protein 5 [Euphorbia lathyris]|uniref:early nodulin-like protein 5 n=1 Tax=Euphorbia lathyris TaxID=212925 RepID=UPI003313136E
MKTPSFFLLFFSCIQLVASVDHIVGGENGWTIPKKDSQFYNLWASNHRFNLNDTLYFKYKKDSVMVVSEDEYKKCKGVHPLFFSNNGDTAFVVDKPGLLYFISGINGHCERGQKMIIKVLEPEPKPESDNPANKKNVSFKTLPISLTFIVLLTFSFLGLLVL